MSHMACCKQGAIISKSCKKQPTQHSMYVYPIKIQMLKPTLALGLKNSKLNSGLILRVETSCKIEQIKHQKKLQEIKINK